MVELGKVERPEAGSYALKKKLYCVANVYTIRNAPHEFTALLVRYWSEVAQQTERLEAAGKIKKIFCENIFVSGEEALDALSKINEQALQFVRKKVEEGAVLLPLETEEIFGQFLDWGNCLGIVRTHEVFTKVLDFYTDFGEKRIEHARHAIESNLMDGEAGLLIMRDEDRMRLQLPPEIEIFLVTPPSYDDLLRWLREKMKDMTQGKDDTEKEAS
jgi:hypothetical protein